MRASRAGSTRSMPQREPAQALGVPGQREEQRRARPARPAAATSPPNLTRANCAGSPEIAPGAAVSTNTANSSSTVTRSSSRSRMIVANAAVALQALAPREQIRPDHFAGAGRQQKRRGKPDNRRPERGAEAGRARSAPADIASGTRGRRRSRRSATEREQQRPRVGAAGFGPDVRHVRRCEGKRPAARGSAGGSGRCELVTACAGLCQSGLESGGSVAARSRRLPANSTTGIAPSLWENVSYC